MYVQFFCSNVNVPLGFFFSVASALLALFTLNICFLSLSLFNVRIYLSRFKCKNCLMYSSRHVHYRGLFFIPALSKHMFISLQLIAPCAPVQRVQE